MDEEDDEYIFFGTPLPELEDEATLRKKAAKELQVRDEKGRQRFHGAFTGGFSAGYFNTVGTKEGWAPATFVSTRSQVADRFQQNPEDFMDDEDFGEFGIATRRIHTTAKFQDVSDVNLRKRKYVDTDSVIPGEAPLKDIVQPVRKSIGIEILEKLGWRVGQGIGPRIKKQALNTRMYGCSPFPDAVLPEEDDPMSLAFTYAPEDTEATFYQPKDNYFGLGYTGLSKESVLGTRSDPFLPTSTKSWLAKDKKKILISGQAFGVGAFEDDDEDIYGKDDMSQYDFSDLTPKDPLNTHKTIESQKDGIPHEIIVGFCLASEPPTVKKHHPAPELPPNFQPIYLKLKLAGMTAQNVTSAKSRHDLSASDRSLILGEKKFQKPLPKEISFYTEKKNNQNQLLSSCTSTSTVPLNFRHFPNDALKQQRYEEYLKLKQEGYVVKLVQPSSMTEWEKQQEMEEFTKAAVLFKPLSSALNSRFESKSHLSVEHEVIAELEKIKKEKEQKQSSDIKRNLIGSSNRKTFEWHPVTLLCKRMNVPNPYPNSSSSGTQSIHKAKSVFDHLSLTSDKSSLQETTISPENHNSFIGNKTNKDVPNEIPQPGIQVANIPDTSRYKPDQLTENKRPPMDLFKDIFENSSSEEEDTTVDVKSEISNKPANLEKEIMSINVDVQEKQAMSLQNPIGLKNAIKLNAISLNTARDNSASEISEAKSKKIGFGVFANLDLDALNQRKSIDRSTQQNILGSESDAINIDLATEKNHNELPDQLSSINVDTYGPELPPNFSGTHATNTCISESSSYSSAHTKSKKHQKYKSKHKHKHHKHKSKKSKKKKSSKRYSDESDSSEEFKDVPPEVIIEKLKKLQKRKR